MTAWKTSISPIPLSVTLSVVRGFKICYLGFRVRFEVSIVLRIVSRRLTWIRPSFLEELIHDRPHRNCWGLKMVDKISPDRPSV
jgi:hypothetical protein